MAVGDILLLKQGDLVPSDCVVIDSEELETDESNITGESLHVKKSEKSDPILLSDSMIVMGRATAIVCCVGPYT